MVISEPILNEFNLDLEKLIKKYVDKIELKQWKTEQLKNIDIKINRETNKDYNLLFSVFLEKLKKLKTYIQAKDITELKKAEVKLRESEERFKYLVSSSPAIIYTSRITGDYGATFISDNVKNLWGYDSKSFTEDPGFWLSSVHPDDKERVLSILSELIDKEHIIYDYRCKIMNSTYRWMRDEVYLLKDNAGNPLEAIGSEIDITDRKLSEQKLMESEEKFRSIAEQSLMGIGILQDEVFKYINEQFANIYGYSVDEILNWPEKEFYKLTHLEDLEFAMEQAQKKQLGAPDVINRYQFRGVKKKGEIIWLEIISHTFSYENKPADLITILDITERKRAEQKLKESEEKFSKAFQSGPNLMAITRREDGYFIDVNDAYIQSLGYNREELIGHSSIEVNIWANSEQRIEFIQKLKESDRVESFEVEVNTKSGKKLTMLFSGEVINLNNEPHLITIANDITDRIKAEKALKESKQLFERTLYSLHDAVFIIDAQTVEILDCNPAASEIFGYSHEDMSGQTTTFLHINEEHLEEFRRNLNHAIEKYGFLKNIEFKMKRKDGTIFNTEHSVLPLLDEKEHQFGWVSVVRDITERKNAEQKLRESEEKYRHLFEKSPFSIVLFDSEGIIKDCNSVTEEMFGFTKEDFLGKNYYHNPSINSDHLPITKKIYDQLKEGESLLPQEMKIFRADGTSLWINSQISRVKIINQTYFYSIIQDITNKKILEDIMFELNQNFFNFTSDFQENIQSLTQTAKKLSKGTLVLYAKKVFHEDDSTVQIISSSNGVINCDFTDFKQKYFINEIFKLKHETPQIFQNLNSNDYTMADSFVQKYSLKGAYGKIIKNTDDFTSIIAILYENIPEISYEEQLVLLLISDAIAIEEKRWQLL
ncbi:MAG: PAS domain-containing protein, partial [Candidatus Lokiarchaeota archaeon]|nr:PAS domain-containing protein [Candidatus Lokiarchaeota archaeon]